MKHSFKMIKRLFLISPYKDILVFYAVGKVIGSEIPGMHVILKVKIKKGTIQGHLDGSVG